MRPPLTLLPVGTLLSVAAGLAVSPSDASAPLRNANHIFNTIHDSMRQWGSSVHHNGVSFFLASVPAGTHFYHGTSESSFVNGTEWLAFEPEHAMVFAQNMRGTPPHPLPHPGNGHKKLLQQHEELRRRGDEEADSGHVDVPSESTNPAVHGYLHTYSTLKDLRLLYVDGMSAAKSDRGPLDSQDVILFNDTIGEGGGWPERERAEKICKMAQEAWAGRIDGIIRMEAGFEIILCAFERSLTLERVTVVKPENGPKEDDIATKMPQVAVFDPEDEADSGKKGKGPRRPKPDALRWLRAIAARYDGVGGNRVSVNYDNFVTAFSQDLDLFPLGPLPRLTHVDESQVAAMQNELSSLIMTHDALKPTWNWQETADMVVTRYSDELAYFASGKISTFETLHTELERVLSPFIDYNLRNSSLEAERCATQFLPESHDAQSLAARAVYGVTHRICSTLLDAWTEPALKSATQKIQDLITYLGWASWKRCRGCDPNEICVVPIWPMGTVQDYENPRCKDLYKAYEPGDNYWEGLHG
ncbi:hypothetical protein NUU61_000858 [Penicillium alfredii]|uniref:Uncharacterized protein n=1 Tax=Penicillium alfredii TaxID=1506179 RepID=A0A9W9GAU9_9EURO|nr:uncharacterized protein NUU61_000858 [Penicillium alfredii]KAJ5115099.1 hypothetical protein NUU61_000858 [Penicillium alfredii]